LPFSLVESYLAGIIIAVSPICFPYDGGIAIPPYFVSSLRGVGFGFNNKYQPKQSPARTFNYSKNEYFCTMLQIVNMNFKCL